MKCIFFPLNKASNSCVYLVLCEYTQHGGIVNNPIMQIPNINLNFRTSNIDSLDDDLPF
jgi:hypothetical protein